MRFCPSCGKQGIKGDFCSECAADQVGFKDVYVKVCYSCQKYFSGGKWLKGTILQAIKETALKNIKTKRKPVLQITFDETRKGPGLIAEAEVLVNEQHIIPAKVQYTYCTQCSLGKSQYFEGVLQLRQPNEMITAFIQKEFAHAKKRGVFATKTQKVANGIDFYTTSNSFIQQLGNKLRKTFGGELKINSRLFSREKQTSKEIHRMAVLYIPPAYALGDVVSFADHIIKLTTTGKQLGGIDLITGKKIKVESKQVEPQVLKIKKVSLAKRYPSPEIIDPDTFQAVPLIVHRPLEGELFVVIVQGAAYQV